MSHFSPTEVDTLLNGKAPKPQASDLPADFFNDMEKRILAAALDDSSVGDSEKHRLATAQEVTTATAEAPTATPTVAMRPRHETRKWLYAAAAVAFIAVCTFAIQHSHRSVAPAPTANQTQTQNYAIDNDIYAVSDEMTEDDIEELYELYEADVFLEEL